MNNGWKKDYLRYKDFFLNVLNAYNQKPNLKKYLELSLSIITVLIFSVFAIKPTVLTIIELNKEITQKEKTSTVLKLKIKNLQAASNLMRSEAQNIEFINQAVPVTAKPEILIRQIESLSKESSLNVLGLSSSDVTLVGKASDVKKSKDLEALPENANGLPFTFSATGSYQNIFSFIQKIENLRRPIMIDSFVINSSVTDTGKILILTISGRVPFLLKNN